MKETPEEEIKETPPPTDAEIIAKLEEEIAALKNKNLHVLADMENLRKRLQKEKIEMNRFAVDNVLTEVLMPLDSFEKALSFTDNMSEETRNWAVGFEMILNQFKEVLTYHKIKPFSVKGKMFDPHRHEAVEMEETDEVPEGTITEELLKGYQSGDRILRPARVKVAKSPVKIKKENNKEEE